MFQIDGRIFRTVNERARDGYEYVRDRGIIVGLVREGLLVDAHEVTGSNLPAALAQPAEGRAYVLEHPRIPFISHPYEWSFGLLKAAALAHLDLQLRLLEYGAKLIDASAYNIQFLGPRPVFIDHLSLRPYVEGELWIGHQQFCQQFINPLLLRAKNGIAHNAWFRGNLEGISTRDLARVLPFNSRFSWNTLTHVLLQARLESRAIASPSQAIDKVKGNQKLSRLAFGGMLRQLRNWISTLHPADTGKTIWGEYAHSHTYPRAKDITGVEYLESPYWFTINGPVLDPKSWSASVAPSDGETIRLVSPWLTKKGSRISFKLPASGPVTLRAKIETIGPDQVINVSFGGDRSVRWEAKTGASELTATFDVSPEQTGKIGIIELNSDLPDLKSDFKREAEIPATGVRVDWIKIADGHVPPTVSTGAPAP